MLIDSLTDCGHTEALARSRREFCEPKITEHDFEPIANPPHKTIVNSDEVAAQNEEAGKK